MRVYVICRKGYTDLNPEVIFQAVLFSEQEAQAWVQRNTFPDAYVIRVYERTPDGGVIEVK